MLFNTIAWRLSFLFLGLVLLGVYVVSPYALLTLILHGLPALFVILPATLFGISLIPLFHFREEIPFRWQILLGASLGIGTLSILILLLGLAGLLQRPVWIVLLTVMAGVGVMRMKHMVALRLAIPPRSAQAGKKTVAPNIQTPVPPSLSRYLWLLAAPCCSLAILAASNAPGWIWAEEGFGYDVLEYHLQLPKEYYQAGSIDYAPHNVYANFPANVEMLYLLNMIVMDEDVEAGVSANMIHLMLGLLTVFAAWVIGREWSQSCGIVCGLVMASTGWLFYLSGLAYVELGMLFFGVAATGAVLRGFTIHPSQSEHLYKTDAWKWFIIGGVLAGFACGCKYTAVVMIALPIAIALLLISFRWRPKIMACCIFLISTLITFSPWLVKNLVMTGNPVFPLANSVFQSYPPGWGEPESQRWNRGHQPKENETSIQYKLGALWDKVVWDHHQRMGPLLFVLSLGGLIFRKRHRMDTFLLVIVVIQLGVWLFATHLFARFAVVLLIPLSLLAGRSLLDRGQKFSQLLIFIILIIGVAWNVMHAATLHHNESPHGAPASIIYEGMILDYEYFKTINHELPLDAHILLVGESRAFYFQRKVDYTVVFNHNPFVEMVESAQNDLQIMQWLREKGVTHLFVHWGEIYRLSKTYGFSSSIEPALFERLEQIGLQKIHNWPHPITDGRYIELFEVNDSN